MTSKTQHVRIFKYNQKPKLHLNIQDKVRLAAILLRQTLTLLNKEHQHPSNAFIQ